MVVALREYIRVAHVLKVVSIYFKVFRSRLLCSTVKEVVVQICISIGRILEERCGKIISAMSFIVNPSI